MYNRYIRNSDGAYTRIIEDNEDYSSANEASAPPEEGGDLFKKAENFLSKILGKFGLDGIDKGDILLIIIIFLVFSESGDEELLVALGLLLIL